jgi:NAD(P)H-nitrite reductase large subunit
MKDQTIICRCSDITLEEVREAIEKGYQTFEEIKRYSRTGMGPCQGRTCMPLILREISRLTKQPMESLSSGQHRPPVNAISLGAIANQGGLGHDE